MRNFSPSRLFGYSRPYLLEQITDLYVILGTCLEHSTEEKKVLSFEIDFAYLPILLFKVAQFRVNLHEAYCHPCDT